MPDISTYLARVGDESRLEYLARTFNDRAEFLGSSREPSEDSQAWASVYRVLALGIESALIQRRTGVTV